MPYRKIEFNTDQVYHICNHGLDDKDIFLDQDDIQRFLLLLVLFNEEEPSGGIFELNQPCNQLRHQVSKLVEIVCYCLNPNHFHLLLKQRLDKGIEKFMQKVGNGYAKYYNNRYKRAGPLFRGPFRAFPVASNEKLLEISAYINLNNRVHNLPKDNIWASSWKEFTDVNSSLNLCSKGIVLDQFSDRQEYINFAEGLLPVFREAKDDEKELKLLGLL